MRGRYRSIGRGGDIVGVVHVLLLVKLFIVKTLYHVVVEIDLFVGVFGGALDGGFETRQGGEGSKLGGPVSQCHAWKMGRHMVWEVDDIVVIHIAKFLLTLN